MEQQIPPHAAAITLGFPSLSYVPTTHTGVGKTRVLAPIDFFMASIPFTLFSPFFLLFRRSGTTKAADPSPPRENLRDEGLRLFLNPAQVVHSQETLGVNLVDVLRARGTRGEPPVFGHDFQPADGTPVPRCVREDFPDLLPRKGYGIDLAWRKPRKNLLLPGRGGRIDPLVDRLSEPADKTAVKFAGVLARSRHHLRREKIHDDAVLVRRPDRPVPPQKGGGCPLLPTPPQGDRRST